MEKIWLKKYPAGVPAEINPDRYTSLVEMFEKSIAEFGKQKAFTNLGHVITYAEFDRLSLKFASFLQNVAGLKPGDRMVIQVPNLIQFPVAFFGAIRAGVITVNTNPLYTPREMLHQFKDSGAKAILILANFANHLEEILPQTDIQTVIITETGDALPGLKRKLINYVVKNKMKLVPAYHLPKAITYNDALKQGEKQRFKPVAIKNTDIVTLQYTGGTTGLAKGAMLTHRNLLANMEQMYAWLSSSITHDEIIITALPLYHIYALMGNLILFFRYGGLNVLITNPRDLPAMFKELKRWPFTIFVGINTLYNGMLNYSGFDKNIFKHVKLFTSGGMALQRAVSRKWRDIVGQQIIEAYGLTETSPGTHFNPIVGDNRGGSIGLPLPSTDVRIVNEAVNDHLEDVPTGGRGELCIKGPQVMLGYWNKPEETAKTLMDGWLRTGDIAMMDPDGYFRIVDRKKDMIVVSGLKVYPSEVEEAVMQNPGVLEVAAVGVPDEKSSEAVKIYIVKKDSSLTEAALREFLKEILTPYKQPRYIEFRSTLPKSNVGKILHRTLREEGKLAHAIQ